MTSFHINYYHNQVSTFDLSQQLYLPSCLTSTVDRAQLVDAANAAAAADEELSAAFISDALDCSKSGCSADEGENGSQKARSEAITCTNKVRTKKGKSG